MHILLLSRTSPLPANNGVNMRTWSVLRALAEEGHEITLVAFAKDSDANQESAELSGICRKALFIQSDLKSLSSNKDFLGRILQLRSRIPYGAAVSRSAEMSRQIETLLKDGGVDAVFCEQTDLVVNFPKAMNVPLIADFHNIDYLILERYLRFERNPGKRLYARMESDRVRKWEQRVCQTAAVTLVCSRHDGEVLGQMCPGASIFIVPNIVDADRYEPSDQENPHRIIFQGGMDWHPNRDAVEFFITSILPLIRRQIPQVKFRVAGRNPPKRFAQRFSGIPGVEFTGTVPDMRGEIASSAISVVPLRIGSGTRLKILEAAAMAKPIVSTLLGAEGLEFTNGQEIILEDEPERFANAVVALLNSRDWRNQLGLAARQRIERQYGFASLRQALHLAMQSIVERTPANAFARNNAVVNT